MGLESEINPFGASEGLEWVDELEPNWWVSKSHRSENESDIPIPNDVGGITPPKSPNFTSLGDLLNEPEEEINWIVDGLLPSSGFSVIAAKPKVGKSTLARQAALSVARGDSFLGRHTTRGAVLYLALEEKRSEVKKHFRLLGAMADEVGSKDLYTFVGTKPQEAHKWLEKEIMNRKPVLVIIDTLFRFVNITDGNDYSKVTAALTPLLSLARDNGAHLMVVHHAGKGGRDGGDSILGSTAIFGSVDTAIILKRTDSKRTIESQQRYGDDIEATVLVFDETTHRTSLGGTKEEDDIRLIGEAILQFLEAKGEPVDEKTVGAEVEGRTGPKRKALREQVTTGAITRTGSGKKGDPFQYSRSLVSDIYEEQEKQDPESVKSIASISVDSRSQDIEQEHNGI